MDHIQLLVWGHLFKIRLDESQSVGSLRDLVHFSIRGVGFAVKDVFFYARVEKNWLLHNVSNLLAKFWDIIILDWLSIDQDLTLRELIESEQQVSDRTFATAWVSYKTNFHSSWDHHIELSQYFLLSRRIVKCYIL